MSENLQLKFFLILSRITLISSPSPPVNPTLSAKKHYTARKLNEEKTWKYQKNEKILEKFEKKILK